MKVCEECKHAVLVIEKRGNVRRCFRLEGKPLCINARELWWPNKNRERDCGPEGKLFEKCLTT